MEKEAYASPQQQLDPNIYHMPIPQPVTMDFTLASEQIPPLFPMLEQMKLEPVDDQPDELLSPIEIEPLGFAEVKVKSQKGKKALKDKSPAKPKRAPAGRKNSKRPTKKQKVEKTSFIASLKGMSSTELEQLAETKPLTAKEQNDLKKYIRMIKNRESAQLSRERRKIYQDTLERALATESERHSSLKQQIIELEAENKVLQREFLEFKNLIENSNLGKAFSSFASNNALRVMTKTAATGDGNAQATFAMYMLICLHAFGQQFSLGAETNPPVDGLVGAVEARA